MILGFEDAESRVMVLTGWREEAGAACAGDFLLVNATIFEQEKQCIYPICFVFSDFVFIYEMFEGRELVFVIAQRMTLSFGALAFAFRSLDSWRI